MQLWRTGLRFLLQSACPMCDRPTSDVFCQDCTRQLRAYQYEHPQQDWHGDLPLFAWGRYEGALKRAISILKYNRQPQIGERLGTWLADAWNLQSPIQPFRQRTIVVPVPLHADREQQRGYNQARIIAKGFCQRTGLSLNDTLMSRGRATEAQFRLSAQQRQANLNQAFSVQSLKQQTLKTLNNRMVLILDDIYTTGATARSLTAALQKSGIAVVGIVAIAKTESFRLE